MEHLQAIGSLLLMAAFVWAMMWLISKPFR